MSRNKFAIAVGATIGLLVLAALVAPRLINSARLRDQIVAQLSDRLHAAVQLGSLRIVLVPLPHVVAEHVSVSIPDVVGGTIESVAITPKLRALFTGKVQPSAIRLIHPDFHVHTAQASTREPPSTTANTAEIKQSVAAALAAVSAAATEQAPGLRVIVQGGELQLSMGTDEIRFTQLQARVHLPPGSMRVELTCASSFSERLTLDASLDAAAFTGRAAIDVTRLRPHLLPATLLPVDTRNLGESEINLAAKLAVDKNGQVQADVDASVPALRLRRGGREVLVRADHLGATVAIDPTTTKIVARDWRITDPRLQLTGELVLDSHIPHASLKVEGEEIDVASIREVATLLAGDVSIVDQIFDVLRAGRVAQVTVQSDGASLADVGDATALVIRGRLLDGEVHVPGVALDLRDVTGDAAMVGGVLSGDHIAARLGNSHASDGSLQIGLAGESHELRVETMVQADVKELPPLLKRLVGSEAFAQQLDRVSAVEGTASGQLRLAGTTGRVTPSVDVSSFDVAGRLEGFQPTVRVKGGSFHFEPDEVSAGAVDVIVGASTLSQVAGRLNWNRRDATFEASARSSRLLLDELYPWLTSTGWAATSWSPQSVSGTLAVRSLRVSGPTATPNDWRFELVGAAENLDIESPALRKHIALRYPVSVHEMRLARDAASGFSLVGKFAAPDGLTGTADVVWNVDGLNIRRLAVRDAESDATMSLLVKPEQLDFAFAGELTKTTLDRLVPDHGLLGGSFAGDFRAQLVRDHPPRSSASGHLTAHDLVLPGAADTHLRITTLSLEGKGGAVAVDAAIDDEHDSHLHLSGSIRSAAQNFILDLDVGADHLDWRELEPLLARSDRDQTTQAQASALPLRGTVRLSSGSFTYDRFTWRPLRAAIVLAPEGPTIRVSEGTLCGIATPSTIAVKATDLRIAVKPTAKHRQLDATATCLGATERSISGQYDLAGEVTSQGRPAELLRAAQGHLDLRAANGRLYHMSVTAKVLSAINIATGSLGDLGDLRNNGLPYTTIAVTADLRDGILILRNAVLNGPTMKMVAQGSVNVLDQTLDVTALVAPLKSVDAVVSSIPLVKGIIGGSLISIPVKVSGPLDNPKVTPLDPSTVGSELVGLMTKTLKLPMKLIEPVWPGSTSK
ncbi:MAG TPA: AsmA-like C-terminal domain-containing protein [Candidatus Kryptonia bacterium]|nr:AsmA-like C-terminal domain-containing protein [Candidatus Kryptonia bacterium]